MWPRFTLITPLKALSSNIITFWSTKVRALHMNVGETIESITSSFCFQSKKINIFLRTLNQFALVPLINVFQVASFPLMKTLYCLFLPPYYLKKISSKSIHLPKTEFRERIKRENLFLCTFSLFSIISLVDLSSLHLEETSLRKWKD